MDADDTIPPSSVEDTQPGQTLRGREKDEAWDEVKGGVGVPDHPERPGTRMSRKVTFDVHATPLGASASDFVFARSEEWEVDLATGRIVNPGPPGTWQMFEGRGILTRCPKCKTVNYLMPQVSKVLPDGRIDPDLRCMAKHGDRPCGWAMRAYLDQAWGKTLYCIAVFNHASKKRDKREFHYGVGNSQQEAMSQVILTPGCTVIAVGPAVGFKVTDKHGEKLIAEG